MKSRIFILVLSLIITVTALAGATYAWFTDSAMSAESTFTTGTVDIQADRDLGDATPGPMFYTTNVEGAAEDGTPGLHETGVWFPGQTVTRQLDVRNIGSLQVRLNQVMAEITSVNDAEPPFTPEITDLAEAFAENMDVKIYVSGHSSDMVLYNGSLFTLLTAQKCNYQPVMQPKTGQYPPVVQLCYEVTMSEDAGNDLQGIIPVVSFWVGAEQTRNNP